MDGDQGQVAKKQRREFRRHEKEREVLSDRRRRTVKRITLWVAIILVLGGATAGLIVLSQRSETQKPGESVPQQSRNHIAEGAKHDPYSTNPPTSGPHYGRTEVPGIYDEELQDELVIHNLEHGAIWMTYKPSKVDQPTIDRLKEISQPYKTKMLLSPREKNDDPIAVVAWQHIFRLQNLDDAGVEQIKAFIKAYRNHGPENAPEETHR